MGCVHLSHKKYHVLNVAVSKEKFHDLKNAYLSNPAFRKEFHDDYRKLYTVSIFRDCSQVDAIASLWDTLVNTENCQHCFTTTSSTNCRYTDSVIDLHYLMDVSDFGEHSEYMYEWSSVGRMSQNVFFSAVIGKGNNIWYCIETKKSQNCFGCVNMHYEKNCVLNKAYSEHEWWVTVSKMIDHMKSTGEWWEFFSHDVSPFWYNETLAQEYYPSTEQQVQEL